MVNHSTVRELNLDEVQAVSGGAVSAADALKIVAGIGCIQSAVEYAIAKTVVAQYEGAKGK